MAQAEPELFRHEALYRGAGALVRLAEVRLTICGAGAVGSNLVDNLVRQGARRLRVIDSDRVEAHNVGTQTYARGDAGAFKVEVLQAEMYRAAGVEIEALRKRLTAQNVRQLLAGADLVVDGFDNHESRRVVTEHCRAAGIPCLHVGLNAGYAEVIWNEAYRVPSDVQEAGANACDYSLARNAIQFAVALASEAVLRFVLDGERQSCSFTLRDLKINREDEQRA
jgi:molybdopterin/thiamine biosynthesis adenylyltransferase